MPELPEVETLRHLLTHHLVPARILDACFPSPVILRGISLPQFTSQVVGKTIVSVRRRGKFLLFDLAETTTESVVPAARLIIHLRMRGGLRVEKQDDAPGKYLCAFLTLNNERNDAGELRYYDMWRWGEWWLAPPAPLPTGIAGLDNLGIEPFDPGFTAEYLHRQISTRRGPLKPLLLGQRVVAGLGNIYCDESLHRACLHPARRANAVSAEEAARLHKAIVSVLEEAIAQGRVVADSLTDKGGNLEQFEGIYTPQVYDRPGHPCPTCGQSLQKISFHGRGTTFCPQCQPDAENASSG